MKDEHKGISLETACQAIRDAERKVDNAKYHRNILVNAAVREFEFSNRSEFDKYYETHMPH